MIADDPRTQLRPIVGVGDATLRVAAALADVARELSETSPRPRGAPYFGLDVSADYSLEAVDAFSSGGLFRKYEVGLEIGCGLGGRSRWLATHAGCRIVGVDSLEAFAGAAALLANKVHMSRQVSYLVASPEALGIGAESFSHVWMFDLRPEERLYSVFAEALRVLRRGGYFVFQLDTSDSDDEDGKEVMRRLQELGAIRLAARSVSLPEPSATCRRGRDKLRQVLRRSWPEARISQYLWESRQHREAVQILGQRGI